ncbi:iron-containing alcohol dehydrogenase [Neobacillus sp. OS1-32]|uniref:iron-containing alcohol dehydrogenase n=1 Tax=Neobacillus sp. OS1-32 TaxID=3070682 RepID=UPI0027E0F070|nr:iron-containing alcohol dehydrogenase [Neobacillus sp. OS1-32]WML31758.1 iron-containing alcohol dehydrogenase [Neobacillus sp. OS1-32]
MQFQFSIPSQVTFGSGCSKNIGQVLAEMSLSKVLFVYDQGVKQAGIVDKILSYLKDSNIQAIEFSNVVPNPPDTILQEGAELAKSENVEALVAVGGGSSIDAAKAINILVTNPGPINQYDGINTVKYPTKPLIAIPTTSGTGSEVTNVTVITDTTRQKKMVIAGRYCGADVALVDPELTIGLPPAITASTGLDALTHAIESYVSNFASVPSEINSLKAIELIYNNIEEAYKNGSNIGARTNMLLGSMLAGYAFNSALLGVVHAIAHPLSVYCGLPHGVANAATLPYCMEFNARAEKVQSRNKDIARAMGINVEGLSDAEASVKAVEEVKALSKRLQIPSLSELGVKREQFEILAEATLREEVSIMANPTKVTKEDILNILEIAYSGVESIVNKY